MNEQLSQAWHSLEGEQTLDQLDSSEQGLSRDEAAKRLQHYGPNRLPQKQRRGPLLRFLSHFHDVLIYIMIAAALITGLMQHWVDTVVIAAVVLINATIGFVQEGKAEKALEAIRGMLSSEARVIRDGAEQTIAAEEVVPGDVVLLRAGEKVPADLRLLEQRDLSIEEAILTGESEPSEKRREAVAADAVLGDRQCMAFSGTLVNFGIGRGVVVASGAHSELGRINHMLGEVEEITTPLLKQMTRFGKTLAMVILVIAVGAFAYGWLLMGNDPLEMFLAAVALAIAAIPEGLPAIMSITLAIGVRRMAARNAIIRQLPAVDTLGSVSVICSDKTGTLTRNEMTLTKIALSDRLLAVDGVGYEPSGTFYQDKQAITPSEDEELSRFLRTACLCSSSHLRSEEGSYRLEGPPTDGAMLVAAMKGGFKRQELRDKYPEIDAIAFASEHKFVARLVADGDTAQMVMMGAPDRLLQRCTASVQDHWSERIDELASQGLRVLGVAVKDVSKKPEALAMEDLDSGMTMLGLAGIIDPPRDEAIQAIAECHGAGIRVVMITGDHALTAKSIAGQIGVVNDTVHTGAEIEAASDAELSQWVRDCSVYARVSPEHKLRLVTALQSNELVVAMTGDGVNDAPAIKRADVGVGMGITGTEVTKEAADMVLLDDNFASIANAVREGRTVYDNLRKSIMFIMPTSGGEAIALLVAIALGSQLPMTAPQILWVNMITAVTLALALAFEPPENDLMKRPPRAIHARILDRYFVFRILYVSLLIGLGSYVMFLIALSWGYELGHAQTIAVNTLVIFEIGYLFTTRFIINPSLSLSAIFGSRMVLGSIAIVVVAQLLYTYLPTMQWLFASTGLSASDWLWCTVPAVMLFLVVECEKAITRLRLRKR